MLEAEIENGMAKVGAGRWLMGRAQPAAALGNLSVRSLRGFIVPDRAAVSDVTAAADCWCASAERPFLTRISALPDEPLHLVSTKLLVAPFDCRRGAHSVKLVPLSFKRATAVTEFKLGWVIAATRGRVHKIAVEDGATLTVRPESLVGWVGKPPTGFCPRLSVLDMILPRAPRNLAYSFHGPALVWLEGSVQPALPARLRPL